MESKYWKKNYEEKEFTLTEVVCPHCGIPMMIDESCLPTKILFTDELFCEVVCPYCHKKHYKSL